ncbi:MAG: D-glycerate dehydrogenase [Betaproteobacteria bacterium]|nr:MAG: D-glycerate dehydrogenase [Betaproteobacteria bacterium]
MSNRPRIHITQPVAQSAIDRLQAVADVRWNPDPLHIMTRAELVAAARDCDILFCLLHDQVDAAVINANPRLKAVASMTITPADIDIPAATARRLPVTVIPALLLDDATADLAWALLLSLVRRVTEGDRLLRSGIYPGSQSCYMEGGGITGKTLGIVGMGGVGRAAAARAHAFKLRVIYHDPQRLPPADEQQLRITWVPFEELLAAADFVSIHAKLTPQTRHLFDDAAFARMKPTAYLINTARGPIVDEAALVRALRDKRIAGAGLDVYENEPQPHPELLNMQNVVMTPHTGSAITELRAAMANVVVDNILALLAGRKPPNCWNAEIYDK